MNTLTKAFVGAGAVVVAAGAGAYGVSEFVLPDIIEAKMNAAFDDIGKQSAYFSDLQIEQTGQIRVERTNNFLTYRATMPGMNSEIQNALDIPGANVQVNVEEATYSLRIDPVETFKALLGQGEYRATMKSLEEVGFNAAFVHTESATDMFGAPSDAPDAVMSAGSCELVENTITLGEHYTLDSKGSDCIWAAELADGNDRLEARSNGGFEFGIAHNGNGGYDGKGSAVFTDFVATAIDGSDESVRGSVTIAKLQLDSTYAGQPASKGKAWADMDLSDLPNDLGMSLDIEGLKVAADGLPPMPEFDFGIGVDFTDLKTDTATAGFKIGYDATGFNLPPNTPESSDCTVRFGNIPAKGLSEIINRHAAAGGDEAQQLIIEEALDHIMAETDLSVGLRCEAMQQGVKSIMKAAHMMKDGAFPGEGSLELRNAEASLQQMMMMAMMLGGPEMAMIIEQIVTLAEQTEESGLKWSYTLDEAGELTVNGQSMGVVMPPQGAAPIPQP